MHSTYDALIHSSRVSSVTRDVLEARSRPDDPDYVALAMTKGALNTLRAVCDQIIPQPLPRRVDLAARIDRTLAEGVGDGWRYAALPADRDAYARGLGTLDTLATSRLGKAFAGLLPQEQHEILTAIAAGFDDNTVVRSDAADFDSAQMRLWFEGVRADAVRLFVATPEMLSRVGYSGVANGGDGMPKSGFVRVGLDEREDWEPQSVGVAPGAP